MNENRSAGQGRGCILLYGVLSLVAGLAAIGSPFLTGALVTTLIGICLMFGGGMELLTAWAGVSGRQKWVMGPVVGGLLAIVAGGIVMVHPVVGAAVIGMLLIVYFLLDGVARSILAFQFRPWPGWGWQLFSGIVSIGLGILLWQSWPLSGLWALGVLIGIRLLFAGFGILTLTGAAASLER